jgi:hydroxymethylpyrimidine/phosphomethylpyrimidine kinase
MDRGDPLVTPIALTIAGSDSGGGAGIQADLKTFAALGVYGATAITALTAQNTRGVRAIHLAPVEIVVAQIDAVLSDFDVAAIKIGMLGSTEIVEAVAGRLRAVRPDRPTPGPSPQAAGRAARSPPRSHGEGSGVGRFGARPFIVYDPVMIASSGDALSGVGFVQAIRSQLLPLVDCLTPNLAEAAGLASKPLARSEDEMIHQGHALLQLGAWAVLMKGGHLDGDAVDILVTADGIHRFLGPRIESRNLHGTGCTLSSAIAAHVVLGASLPAAVGSAKEFVRAAIERGRDVTLGGGAGPVLQYFPGPR